MTVREEFDKEMIDGVRVDKAILRLADMVDSLIEQVENQKKLILELRILLKKTE